MTKLRSKEFKFTKIKKRKIYETWINKDYKSKIVIYILKTPKNYINSEYYHFQISSTKSLKYDIRYDSIYDLQIFNTYNEVENAVKNWWHKNLKG
jgi:hypothetical protein